jgi:3-phenylpropionate/cinnamic acid dioxygenase small subunit
MALSTDDRAALHDLYARYAHTFDGGDATAWADLFASDGAFAPPGVEEVVGTDALRDFVELRASGLPGMRHVIANVLVEEAEGGARGSAYFLCFRLSGDGRLRIRNSGRYDDRFVRVGGEWKIARRDVVSELPVDLVDAPFLFEALA